MMKDILLKLIALTPLLWATACTLQDSNTDTPEGKSLVYIITPSSHPSLEAAIDGFRQGVAESGWDQSKLDMQYSNANGEISSIPRLVDRAIRRNADLLFVLSTPAAAAAVKKTNPAQIPLVYAAVTDPVKAGIVTEMQHSDTFATGVSDRYPVREQVQFFTTITPSAQQFGLLFNPAEQNSQILVNRTEQALTGAGKAPTRYEAAEDSEVAKVATRAFAECDAVIINGDNLFTNNLPTVINVAVSAKKPLYVGDPDSVERGALGTVGPSYRAMGRQAGQKAAKVLSGESIKQIPSEYPQYFDYVLNVAAAASMGVTIPRSAWELRSVWKSVSGRGTD
ncbi:hypothetical protein CKO31_23495 [Thiohalocapsa halophila]|uniref:ABC transporter substrate-binding protein n=1 Tax=Thiohalocapsa halophila TaxID=69359 RepID=A0ABS1CNZ9_9GAMM|nr:ABC transporter substrate-binding protein [Thiohalocapsa halophila]MBK1633652.1 hypothetical protein [Thiohalocapsa halophila]